MAIASEPLAVGNVVRISKMYGGYAHLRRNPDFYEETFFTVPDGDTMSVIDGPVSEQGVHWYQVRYGEDIIGWVVAAALDVVEEMTPDTNLLSPSFINSINEMVMKDNKQLQRLIDQQDLAINDLRGEAERAMNQVTNLENLDRERLQRIAGLEADIQHQMKYTIRQQETISNLETQLLGTEDEEDMNLVYSLRKFRDTPNRPYTDEVYFLEADVKYIHAALGDLLGVIHTSTNMESPDRQAFVLKAVESLIGTKTEEKPQEAEDDEDEYTAFTSYGEARYPSDPLED